MVDFICLFGVWFHMPMRRLCLCVRVCVCGLVGGWVSGKQMVSVGELVGGWVCCCLSGRCVNGCGGVVDRLVS